jgi:two-component system, cell cycle response regulator DivK
MSDQTYHWHDKVILVADDTPINYKLLETALRQTGVRLIWVQTGHDAVDAVKKYPEIDLVLMDIRMPEMDGYEATRIIREFNPDINIIAQTSYAMQGNREESLQAGCNDYICKPIILDDLKQLLSKYLNS